MSGTCGLQWRRDAWRGRAQWASTHSPAQEQEAIAGLLKHAALFSALQVGGPMPQQHVLCYHAVRSPAWSRQAQMHTRGLSAGEVCQLCCRDTVTPTPSASWLCLDGISNGVRLQIATHVAYLNAQGCEQEIWRQIKRSIDEWLESRGLPFRRPSHEQPLAQQQQQQHDAHEMQATGSSLSPPLEAAPASQPGPDNGPDDAPQGLDRGSHRRMQRGPRRTCDHTRQHPGRHHAHAPAPPAGAAGSLVHTRGQPEQQPARASGGGGAGWCTRSRVFSPSSPDLRSCSTH